MEHQIRPENLKEEENSTETSSTQKITKCRTCGKEFEHRKDYHHHRSTQCQTVVTCKLPNKQG